MPRKHRKPRAKPALATQPHFKTTHVGYTELRRTSGNDVITDVDDPKDPGISELTLVQTFYFTNDDVLVGEFSCGQKGAANVNLTDLRALHKFIGDHLAAADKKS